ncbi:MAG: hypothetical protein KDA97_12900 [Acidimicrobiales bacterium]|nr:hypothetical protein [Acidimicrobiales bacterium]
MDTSRILIYGEHLGELVDALAYIDRRLAEPDGPGGDDPPDVEPLMRAISRAERDVVLDRAWAGLPRHPNADPTLLFSEVVECIRSEIDAVLGDPLHLRVHPKWRRTPPLPDEVG